MPVIAMPARASSRALAPRIMARTVSSLTAPWLAMTSAGTPSIAVLMASV